MPVSTTAEQSVAVASEYRLTRALAGRAVRRPDTVRLVELVGRWWNGERGASERRDIWLTSDGQTWTVRARLGTAGGPEVHHEFGREYEARAMVDRLIAAAPGRWKDVTRLVRKPDLPVPKQER